MSRERFAALIEKYQEGTCTDEEKKLVEYWFALLESEVGEKVSGKQLDDANDRMWSQLQQRAGLEISGDTKVRYPVFKWLSIAASLIFACWFLAGKIYKTEQLPVSGWIERRNDGTMPVLILLEDSSTVELSPGSKLRYPAHFEEQQRVVLLEGKGFFDIHKNPAKPFYVHSGKMVTRVLGTSFYVDNLKTAGKTKVEVVTGLVQVYTQAEPQMEPQAKKAPNQLLRPNHTATFDPESRTFALGLAVEPKLLNAKVSFQFKNARLYEVSQQLTQAWGIRVEGANKQILNCPITANLSGQPLFTQLDIICAALNARYTIRGNTILISGPGCKSSFSKKQLNRPPMQT
ncbi:FecR family protein [Dyadobacter aurulentus]|uniref:FecR family protein n=1 Tax=Dyadobacter sp. UC 10 TaxID=2605428 RepID=UPI0011F311B3|nr:FecR family protein [Dyadobacter sp. UC 10]KAA0992168.1 FecR family protein [Dyadobacter sp. UC 10]